MIVTTTVYKIVHEENGRFFSAGHGDPLIAKTDMAVEYVVGEKAIPKIQGSLLFAFSRIPDAVSEAAVRSFCQLWKASAEVDTKKQYNRLIPPPIAYDGRAAVVNDDVWRYWSGESMERDTILFQIRVSSVLLCENITLKERVFF